jgi:segregation and condensation protein A
MDTYKIRVQDFEGPLDLLIHLIEKDKIDIYDIPIVSVTEQYIAYINSMKEYNLDIASEFLLMAAILLQIKSKMLLPKLPTENEEDDVDPRQMLVEMLVEYRKVKARAVKMREAMDTAHYSYTRKPMPMPNVRKQLKPMSLDDLLTAVASLVSDEDITTQIIARQEFHVHDKMDEILNLLGSHNNAIAFTQALDIANNRSEKIAAFLAVLELLRLKKISIRQKEAFAPIYLFLREDNLS